MRNFWIGVAVMFYFSSCEKEINLPFEFSAEKLVGKWELYQFRGNTGGGDYRTPYEPSGKTITFFSNGKLSSVNFFDCSEGEYQVVDLDITLFFDCEGEVAEQGYSMSGEGEDLVISPTGPFICIEGCSYIFKRIN